MANTTYGKPLVTGSVLRSDSRSRPTAREPSLLPASGFPRAIGLSSPPGPRPVHPEPVQCYRKRNTKRRRSTSICHGTPDAPPMLSRSITGIGLPVPVRNRNGRRVTDAVLVAQARFRTGLTP